MNRSLHFQILTISISGIVVCVCACTGMEIVADIDTPLSEISSTIDTETETETETSTGLDVETMVIAGRDCFLGYSEDGGLTWSESRHSGSCDGNILEGIAYGNRVWVVVGSGETVLRSIDGKSWDFVEGDLVPGSVVDFECVVWDGDQTWIASGSNGKLIFSQDNALTWDSPSGSIASDFALQSIATNGDGRWVVVSDGGYVAYSDHPWSMGSWEIQQLMVHDFESVTFGEGKFIAVGGKGSLFTSDDGVVWTLQEGHCVGRTLEDVVYNGTDQWVILGDGGCISISSSGLAGTWSESVQSLGSGAAGIGYVSSVERWVVVGSTGMVLYSDDSGSTWQPAFDDAVLSGSTPLLMRGN